MLILTKIQIYKIFVIELNTNPKTKNMPVKVGVFRRTKKEY
jgi:hypothetical protein